ncbi:ATP-binding protein [Lutibacter sp.]|uniref:tetratricopeptide repeat-containing sensor histidine kinase n=1 Tax=Lutibacter sp. TaxID=1925666 RepID=UPI001A2C71A7|nr:ATP-binding protein [Lutibacter sp.]MBI9042742.1 hypothetical protein [Lutibacter sp.]
MKIVKVAVLFFCLLQFSSCNKKEKIETSETSLDSIDFYIEKMKDLNLVSTVCLKYADSALSLAKKESTDTLKIEEILNFKVYLLGSLMQNDSAIFSSKKLIDILVKRNNTTSLHNYYATLAYYYSISNKKDSAFIAFKKSNDIAFKLKDSLRIGENLASMAIIQSDFGDFNGSDVSAIKALQFLNQNNLVGLTSVYNCIAINAKKQRDYKEAIYWNDKALKICSNDVSKISLLNNEASYYRYLKEYDKSISTLTNLLNDSLVNTIPKTKARILDNLAFTKWQANEKEAVLNELILALNIRIQENDWYGQLASYGHLSDYYSKKDTKKSVVYAEELYKVATVLKSPQDQIEALQKLVKFSSQNEAKQYYNTYIKISDSINNAEKSALNKFAKIKYDSEKNREDNLQLTVKTVENELALQKEKTRNLIGALSSGTVLVGFICFGFYLRQKHKQEKRAEVYKTETRIAKKIHDEVANNVVNIMNKVQYTDEGKEVLLNELEKVYLLTRNISHENNAIETGEKFEYFLKAMLSSFNNDSTTVIMKDIHSVGLNELEKVKQIELFRILQELMVNMRKHSEASLVAITFKIDGNSFLINYSDNGVGLDIKEINFKNGLQNVETRIKSINGTITFVTSLGNGFKAFISLKK